MRSIFAIILFLRIFISPMPKRLNHFTSKLSFNYEDTITKIITFAQRQITKLLLLLFAHSTDQSALLVLVFTIRPHPLLIKLVNLPNPFFTPAKGPATGACILSLSLNSATSCLTITSFSSSSPAVILLFFLVLICICTHFHIYRQLSGVRFIIFDILVQFVTFAFRLLFEVNVFCCTTFFNFAI